MYRPFPSHPRLSQAHSRTPRDQRRKLADSVCGTGQFLGTAIGSAATRDNEGLDCSSRWIADKAELYGSSSALKPSGQAQPN